MMRRILFLLALHQSVTLVVSSNGTPVPSAATTTLTPAQSARLNTLVEATLTCADIPALSLAIVNRTDVLMTRGYGVANPKTGRNTTDETLFAIGSTTKAFTSALLALLIDRHADRTTRFNWTTPLRTILGDSFVLYNDVLTSQTTLEDVLSHRTGIPDYFLLLVAGYPYHVTRQEVVRSLRYHKPEFPFRAEYSYNNHLFMLAGYVAEVLESGGRDGGGGGGGASWEQLVRRELLEPLGMTATTFVRDVLMTSPEDKMAASCAWEDSEDICQPVELKVLDQVDVAGPAGAIVSSARDMARWMMWHLDGGRIPRTSYPSHTQAGKAAAAAGRQLIPKNSLWETYAGRNMAFGRQMRSRDLRTKDGDGGRETTDEHVSYNLGWMTSFYRGHRRIWHSGSISTYKAQVWLYPDSGLGIFVALSGPQRPDTTAVLLRLMHDISDVLLLQPDSQLQQGGGGGEDRREGRDGVAATSTSSAVSWLDSCDVDLLVPASPSKSDLNQRQTSGSSSSSGEDAETLYQNRPPRRLRDYVGVYVSEQFGNVTVTYDEKFDDEDDDVDDFADEDEDEDEEGGVLRLSVGRMLTARLWPYDCRTDDFYAQIGGRLWWMAESVADSAGLPGLPVHFGSTTSGYGGTIDVLELPLQAGPGFELPRRRSRFVRLGVNVTTVDLEWSISSSSSKVRSTCSSSAAMTVVSRWTSICWLLLLLLFSAMPSVLTPFERNAATGTVGSIC
jgi:CubicO group peptidase (beta-lactamase class C family)